MLKIKSTRIKIGLAAIFCLAGIKFFIVPFSRWQHGIVEKVKILRRSTAKKKAIAGSEQEIEASLQKARASFEKARKFYFSNFSDPQALQLVLQKRIEALSSESGIKIKSTDWLYPSEDNIVQAPIRIRCEAEPAKIIDFIRLIENSRYFLSIDFLKITCDKKKQILSSELNISAYGVKK